MDIWSDHPIRHDVRWDSVHSGLSGLARKTIDDPYTIWTGSPDLLTLEHIRGRVASDATPMEVAEACAETVRERVVEIQDEPHGRLLRTILAVDPEECDDEGRRLVDLNLTERRDYGGRTFRGPRNKVGAHGVRMTYEPAAFRRLTVMILRDEVRCSGFSPADEDDQPDNVLIYFPRERVPETGHYLVCDGSGCTLRRQNACEVGGRFPAIRSGSGEYGWVLISEDAVAVSTTTV